MATTFAQTQTMVSRIRKILQEYPFGNAIFLELLQNADDAGADVVKVAFETFSAYAGHPAASSPALLAFNSAQFTERDLQNIQHIGGDDATSKQHDASKVGRFGLGFNSCYHISDVVAFVSGKDLLVFDPQCKNLPLNEGRHDGGLRWDFIQCFTDPRTTPEQREFLEPLLAAFEGAGFGFRRDRPFDGTIFRLPLRQSPSALWKRLHAPRDMISLLLDLRDSAQLGMTLLKNVTSVSAFLRRSPPPPRSAVSAPLEPVFTICVGTQRGEEVAKIRRWLQAYSAVVAQIRSDAETLEAADVNPKSTEWDYLWAKCSRCHVAALPEPCEIDVALDIHTTDTAFFGALRRSIASHTAAMGAAAASWDASTVTIEERACTAPPAASMRVQFLVRHQLGPAEGWGEASSPTDVWRIARTSALESLPVDVPWSAVIVNVDEATTDGGRLMCFFPIGQGTGLPVHVHGFFHLSSDRQSIKSFDQDEWNAALIKEVTPAAYAGALLAAREHALPGFYARFPTCNYSDRTIAQIAGGAMTAILRSHLFFTATGKWVTLATGELPLITKEASSQGHVFSSVDPLVQVPLHRLLVACAAAAERPLITCPTGPEPSQQTEDSPPLLPLIEHLQTITDVANYNFQIPKHMRVSSTLLTPTAVRQLLAHISLEDARRLFPLERRNMTPPEAGTTVVSDATLLAMTLFEFCVGNPHHTIASHDALVGLPLVALASGRVVWARAVPPALQANHNTNDTTTTLVKAPLRFSDFAGRGAQTLSNKDCLSFCASDPELSPYLVATSAATYDLGALLFPSLLVVSDFAPIIAYDEDLDDGEDSEEDNESEDNNESEMEDENEEENEEEHEEEEGEYDDDVSAETIQCIEAYARQTRRPQVLEMLGLCLINMMTVSKLLRRAIDLAPTGSRCVFVPPSPSTDNQEWCFTLTDRHGDDLASTVGSGDVPFLVPSTALFDFIANEWAAATTPAALEATAVALRVMPIFPTMAFPHVESHRTAATIGIKAEGGGATGAAPLIYFPSNSTAMSAEAGLDLCEQLSLCGLASVIDTNIAPVTLLEKLSPAGIVELDGDELAHLLEKGLSYLMLTHPTAALFPLSAAVARALPSLATAITVEAGAVLAALPIYRTVDGRLCAIRHKGASNRTDDATALPISPDHPATLILPSIDAVVSAFIGATADGSAFSSPADRRGHVTAIYQRLATERAPSQRVRPLQTLNVLTCEEYSSLAFAAFAADILKVRVATPLEVLLLAVFVIGPVPAVNPKEALSQPTLERWVWSTLLQSLASAGASSPTTDTILHHLLELVGEHRCFVDHFASPPKGPPRLVKPNQAVVFFGECEDETAAREVIALVHAHSEISRGKPPSPGYRSVCVLDHIVSAAGCDRAALRSGIALIGATTTTRIKGAHCAALVEMFGAVIQHQNQTTSDTKATMPKGGRGDRSSTPITHRHVCLMLKVIEKATLDPEDRARIEGTAFLPSYSPAQYIHLHPPDEKSRSNDRPQQTEEGSFNSHSTIVTPGQCRVEAVFRTCPSAHFCLPDVIAPEDFPLCAMYFKWATPFTFEELLDHNAAACCSAEERERSAESNVLEHNKNNDTNRQSNKKTSHRGGSTTTTATVKAPPPPQFHASFARDCLLAMERMLTKIDSSGHRIHAIPEDTRLYLPDYDTAAHGHQISFNAAALGTEPLFYFVPPGDLHLLNAVRARPCHTLEEIAAATHRVPALHPAVNGPDVAADAIPPVKITDAGRALYKHLLGYFETVVGNEISGKNTTTTSQTVDQLRRRVQALNLTVPTADGGVNEASKVTYHYSAEGDDSNTNSRDCTTPSGSSAVLSHTMLWAGIQPSVAKAAGMAHAGLRVVMQQGRSPFIRPRGQQVSLVDNIKGILHDYSDESLVLLEMVQNADDAKANSVHIYIDERTMPATGADETFFGRNMKLLQGPALVIVNDSQFTTEDISALMDIGCGHKTTRPDTIGRFGRGFNAVYHVTDCPTIVTGDHTIILDPAIAYIEGSDAQAGFAIQHTRVPNLRQQYPEQLAAFSHYGVDFSSVYPKSLFRLPLRTKETVEQFSSRKMMSSHIWDVTRAKELVADFGSLAESTLLFLNHLTKIEASVVTKDDTVEPLFCTQLLNTADVQRHRDGIRTSLAPFGAFHPTSCSSRTRAADSDEAPLDNDGREKDEEGEGGEGDGEEGLASDSIATDTDHDQQERSQITNFHVGRSVGGNPEKRTVYKVAVVARQGSTLSDIPIPADVAAKATLWGAIAVPMDDSTALPASSTFRGGRLHCFLPLPIGGLPFHVHAAFALKSDRRGLWTRSTMTGNNAEWQATFNQAILSQVIPRAFCLSVADCGHHILKRLSPKDHRRFWSQFPVPATEADGSTETAVQDLCRLLYAHILGEDECILLAHDDPAGLFKPSSVFLCLPLQPVDNANENAFQRTNTNEDDDLDDDPDDDPAASLPRDLLDVLREVLRSVDKRVVEMPPALLRTMTANARSMVMSPAAVRDLLLSSQTTSTVAIPPSQIRKRLVDFVKRELEKHGQDQDQQLKLIQAWQGGPAPITTVDHLYNLATLPLFREYRHSSATAHAASGLPYPYEGDFTALPLAAPRPTHQAQAQALQGSRYYCSQLTKNIVDNIFSLPGRMPRSPACDGLLMTPCTPLGVEEIDDERFLLKHFIPHLDSMSLDDELTFWAFAAKRNYIPEISESAADLLTFHTSRCHVSLSEASETMDLPVPVPLAVQIVRKCVADHLWPGEAPPDMVRSYTPLTQALDRQYVCDHRSSTFAVPLLNQRAETPVPDVLHRLHALLHPSRSVGVKSAVAASGSRARCSNTCPIGIS